MATADSQQDRSIRLVLIDDDPVFRLGLVAALTPFGDLQVVLTSASQAIVAQPLAPALQCDVIVLSIDSDLSASVFSAAAIVRHLRRQFPTQAILLLSYQQDPAWLRAAIQSGANGFCLKSSDPSELVQVIRQLAAGQPAWDVALQLIAQAPLSSRAVATPLQRLRQNWRRSGLRQIDGAVAELTRQLQSSQLSALDQLVLTGRRRELRAAGWLLNRLLATPALPDLPGRSETGRSETGQPEAGRTKPSPLTAASIVAAEVSLPAESTAQTLQAAVFDTIAARLDSTLVNLTGHPLEIDILKQAKKRELLALVLRKLEAVLEELRFSQLTRAQLAAKQTTVLQDIWRSTLSDFFGRYYMVQVGNRSVALVDVLLQEAAFVQSEILDKIPFVAELLAHFLFQVPLAIEDQTFSVGTIEAMARADLITQHFTIQLANAVIQPLLNRLGDVPAIKQTFYDKRLLSSREIERFRNDLSWHYRTDRYFAEPTAIFESRYSLFHIQDSGIRQVSIYAPRNDELAQLSGIRFVVTLALEARDAVAPRVRSAISFLGSGAIYVLTEVIGRSLGLIGRGIIKGVGNALHDTPMNRGSDR